MSQSRAVPARVSPVIQFLLLMVPIVMSGFFLVYSLTGISLEGKDKYNWSIEATDVALMVGGTISGFSLLVLIYARWKGVRWFHPLNLSGFGHLVLAILLTAIVFVTVQV